MKYRYNQITEKENILHLRYLYFPHVLDRVANQDFLISIPTFKQFGISAATSKINKVPK